MSTPNSTGTRRKQVIIVASVAIVAVVARFYLLLFGCSRAKQVKTEAPAGVANHGNSEVSDGTAVAHSYEASVGGRANSCTSDHCDGSSCACCK